MKTTLGAATYAVAMIHGLRGDEEGRSEWTDLTRRVGVYGEWLHGCNTGYTATFDATVHLHEGDPEAAVARLEADPERFREWYSGSWRSWYAALWAEAAVLAGRDDAARRIERARFLIHPNPVASALLDRAAALLAGDRDGLLRAAEALEPTGFVYQWARTLLLAGGTEAAAGEAALVAEGIKPRPVR